MAGDLAALRDAPGRRSRTRWSSCWPTASRSAGWRGPRSASRRAGASSACWRSSAASRRSRCRRRPGRALVSLTVETDRGTRVMAELAAPLPAGLLVAELARRTTVEHLMSPGWPVLGARTDEPTALAAGRRPRRRGRRRGGARRLRRLPGRPAAPRHSRRTTAGAVAAEPHAVTGRVQDELVAGPLDELGGLRATAAARVALPPPGGRARRPRTARRDARQPGRLHPPPHAWAWPVLRPVPEQPAPAAASTGCPETVVDTRRGPGDATVARLRDRDRACT